MLPFQNDRHPLLLGALLAATTLTPLAGARAAGWSATSTLGIPVAALANATDVGALPGMQTLTVRVGMRMRNQASLLGWLKAFTTPGNFYYGRYFTPAEFAHSYGASSESIAAVTAYLQAAGFTNIVAEPNGLLISADGTAAMAEAAFNTKLEQISVGGTPGFMNIAPAQVPAKFGNVVAGVLGLNTVGRWASTMALPLPQYLVSYTPTQFQQIYSAKVGQPSPNATIAIMAEGDLTGVLSDLRIAEAAFGLPRVPVTVVPVGLPSSDTSGADEWDLDTQFSTGMAQWVHRLYLYDTTSLSDSDLALEISRWATDDLARAASASLGECEAFPYIDGSMTIDDEIFLEAAVQAGVNGVPAGAPLVNYPAASPYVVGVGGTTLLTNTDGSYNSEVAWNTGGGGISQFEGSPEWQGSDVTLLGTANSRGVPDVAMDADPNSGATVYVNGAPEAVGGTSLSSPLALGVWARAISANPKLGFASPKLYSLYDGTGGTGGLTGTYPKGGYHDITIGNNGLYDATVGYDLITGLGTFYIDELLKDLHK
jgi:subtilase family serine protease